MSEKTCTDAQNNASAAAAHAEGAERAYGPAYVEVLAVVGNTVTFRTARKNSEDPVEVKCTWTHANVWPRCPSTLDCDDAQLPAVDAQGILYLSRSLIAQYHVDSFAKWPDDLAAAGDYQTLRIWPTSVELSGVELRTGMLTKRTINLIDPSFSKFGQSILLNGRPLELELSSVAFDRFLVPWASPTALKAAYDVITEGRAAHSAAELAAAWAQVAAWDGAPAILDSPDHAAARKILDALQKA